MLTVADISQLLESHAPLDWQQSWDHSGLQLGSPEAEIRRILFSLDLDSTAVERAIELEAKLIISHHPLFFHPLTNLTTSVPEENNVIRLIKNDINVYSAHTNLDAAPYGVNWALASALGLERYLNTEALVVQSPDRPDVGLIRTAQCTIGARALWQLGEERLSCRVQSNFDADCMLDCIGLAAGAFDADWIPLLLASGVQLLITGELRHHEALALAERGIRVLALGHKTSERPVLQLLGEVLREKINKQYEGSVPEIFFV